MVNCSVSCDLGIQRYPFLQGSSLSYLLKRIEAVSGKFAELRLPETEVLIKECREESIWYEVKVLASQLDANMII